MEHAPLRPVPARPERPVEPREAVAHLAAVLPVLDETERATLALVEIVGRSRHEAATALELGSEEAGAALARARTALRRSMFPLPGSGWCERAERLISDRLDGELEPPGPARLEVHLRNCSRCVEHERRLAQATDRLVRDFLAERRAPTPALVQEDPEAVEPEAVDPEAVDPEAVEPEAVESDPLIGDEGAWAVAAGEGSEPRLRLVQPQTEPRPAVRPEVQPPVPEPAPAPAPERPEPESLEPETLDPEAAEEAVAVATPTKPSVAASVAAFAWHVLFALAVVLAVATVVITVLGATGADPV